MVPSPARPPSSPICAPATFPLRSKLNTMLTTSLATLLHHRIFPILSFLHQGPSPFHLFPPSTPAKFAFTITRIFPVILSFHILVSVHFQRAPTWALQNLFYSLRTKLSHKTSFHLLKSLLLQRIPFLAFFAPPYLSLQDHVALQL
jgi:hypothetical protein